MKFYRIFHSYRYVKDKLVIRLNHRISKADVERINDEFGDLVVAGKITQALALEEEANEDAILDLPRLIFTTHRKKYGRLRLMIDAINEATIAE